MPPRGKDARGRHLPAMVLGAAAFILLFPLAAVGQRRNPANNPAERTAVLDQVTAAIGDGRPDAAEDLARQALQHWPRDPEILHLLGLAEFRLNKLQPAAADLAAAQKIAPGDAAIAFDLGLVYMTASHHDLAARQFERSLAGLSSGSQRSAVTHILLGRAYQNSNRTRQAIEQFQAALRLNPKIPLGHYHLGFAFESLGESAKALSELELEAAQTRDNPEVFYRYGHMLAETGAWERAVGELNRALQLNPQHADALYDLGKTLLLMGNTPGAVAALRRSVAVSAGSANSHYQLSRALAKSGDAEGARAEMERFAELKKMQQPGGASASGMR